MSAGVEATAVERAVPRQFTIYVTAGGVPDDGTRRYLAERCGATTREFPARDLMISAGAVPRAVERGRVGRGRALPEAAGIRRYCSALEPM